MENKKQSFQDLLVWKKSIELSAEIYQVTNNFPKEEIFGLTNQIRRSSVSIPSNIAEGAARYSKSEFNHFLSISIGSIAELKTQLMIAEKVKYLSNQNFKTLISKIEEISKMITSLRNKI